MTLRYVFPRFVVQRFSHSTICNIVLFREMRRSNALSVELSRFDNLRLGEFRTWVIRSVRMAIFSHHIRRIIRMRTQEVMCGIATTRPVTMVTHNKPLWDGAVCQFVGNAVSRKRLPATANMDSPVAHRICATLPVPTGRAKHGVNWPILVNVRPKAFLVRTAARVMSMNVANWFTLYMAATVFVSDCYRGFFAAAASTISSWNFKCWIMGRACEKRELWGTIIHSNSSPLEAVARSQDAPTSLAISIPFSRSIVAQKSYERNALVAELSAP